MLLGTYFANPGRSKDTHFLEKPQLSVPQQGCPNWALGLFGFNDFFQIKQRARSWFRLQGHCKRTGKVDMTYF